MDISISIKKTAADLIEKAKILQEVKIEWQPSIEINCTSLTSLDDLKKSKLSDGLISFNNKSAVYYFLVKDTTDMDTIVRKLETYKKNKQRSCPKIDKKRGLESRCLYCGSVKKGLSSRLFQHIGFGSRQTYALQLVHWAKELDLVVEFNYGWIDSKYVNYTELVEYALVKTLNPLVGKMHSI